MISFKSFSLRIVLLPLFLLACFAAINVALDPYHILAKGPEYPFMNRSLKYYRNAGIINHYAIRNIIVGGSLMNNLLPSEVEKVMKWESVYSLTLNAADAASVAATVRHAVRHHDIQNIVYSLQPDRLSDISPLREAKKGAAKNFIYLYDDSRLNDLMSFLQLPIDSIKEVVDARRMRGRINNRRFPGFSDGDMLAASKDLYATYINDHYRTYNRPLFISSLSRQGRTALPLTEDQKKNVAENYTFHIEPLIQQNPGINFYFIIPPGSFLSKYTERHSFSYALGYLCERLLEYPNVKIFSFINDSFNADLRLYKDYNHFHVEVSRFMLQSLGRDSHRVTKKNLDEHIAAYNALLADYRVPSIWAADYYPLQNGPYPKEGYITYRDAARLVWGPSLGDNDFEGIPRSPYLAEETYVTNAIETVPALEASRDQLLSVKPLPRTRKSIVQDSDSAE